MEGPLGVVMRKIVTPLAGVKSSRRCAPRIPRLRDLLTPSIRRFRRGAAVNLEQPQGRKERKIFYGR